MAMNVKEPVATATSSTKNGGSLISHDKLRQLYSTMLQCRMLEEKALGLKKMARFKDKDSSTVGQEAAFVGAAIDLRPEDAVAPSQHDFIANFIQGVPLNALFSRIYGRATSVDKGRSPSQRVFAPIPSLTLAAQLNLGNGIALANKTLQNETIVIAFFAADSTSLESLHEALHFADAHDLPIVFVCQNNFETESVPLRQQTNGKDIRRKAQAYGFPSIPVDGNDAVAMYRVAYESIQRARNGGGPTWIEAKTHRRDARSSMNPNQDPLTAMEGYLTQRNLFTPAWKQQIMEFFSKEMNEAIRLAEKSL